MLTEKIQNMKLFLKEFDDIRLFPFSAQTGEGAESIIGVINESVEEYLKDSEEE